MLGLKPSFASTKFGRSYARHLPMLRWTGLITAIFVLMLAGIEVANAQQVAPPAASASSRTSQPLPVAQAATPSTAPTTPEAATAPPANAAPISSTPEPALPSLPNAAPLAHDIAPAATASQPVVAVPVAAKSDKIPHDLSPWGMFMQADIVVKVVMIGLLLASLSTWTVWVAKTVELKVAKSRLCGQLRKLGSANSLREAESLVAAKRGAVPAMLDAAIAETRASWDITDKHTIKERVTARLERVELAAGRDINRGTGILATIGSTSPFVGLFGTVWGIMNSFIGISETQTTNLAVVAPGIAEALLATAVGLVAAIPAVIIYNQFARAIGGYKALVGDASVAVQCLASRDFDRGVRPELRAAE